MRAHIRRARVQRAKTQKNFEIYKYILFFSRYFDFAIYQLSPSDLRLCVALADQNALLLQINKMAFYSSFDLGQN